MVSYKLSITTLQFLFFLLICRTRTLTTSGVELTELFRADELFKEVNSKNRTLMEKISMIDALGKDEQQAIFKMIDLAISNKKMKDNLTQLIAQ